MVRLEVELERGRGSTRWSSAYFAALGMLKAGSLNRTSEKHGIEVEAVSRTWIKRNRGDSFNFI